jgi:hypothetical protein
VIGDELLAPEVDGFTPSGFDIGQVVAIVKMTSFDK